MLQKKENQSETADREVVIIRLLNAPRELVWDVWTKPEHMEKWWGPNGHSISNVKIDAKVGGVCEFVMRHPDGSNFECKNTFTELVKPERIVMEVDHPKHIAVVNFAAEGKKTRITWSMIFESKEELEEMVRAIQLDECMKQTYDKMETYLVSLT